MPGHRHRNPLRPKVLAYRYVLALGTTMVVVFAYRHLPVNPTTVALTFLLIVLAVAIRWGLTLATTTAIAATLEFNYYFLPPVRTFTIADPQNWIALIAFLASAIIASRLSERARREAQNATRRRKEVEQLYQLSQQLLSTENVVELLNEIPRYVQEVFDLRSAALYLSQRKLVYRTGPEHPDFSEEQLKSVSGRGELSVEEDSQLCFVPLRVGVRPVGAIGLEGVMLSREGLEALASLIAISIERAGAVEASTRAEAARESEKLRSALLDSVTHEFRTPLTSIKASVTTLLSDAAVDAEGRRDLLTVINEETDRLNRLVGEAAEMSQLDAHLVELHRGAHRVQEVVHTAMQRVAGLLQHREVRLNILDGLPPVDADLERLSEALVHLLENATKYSPTESPITVSAEAAGNFVDISVADRGAGIDSMEQTLIFEKFYRGRDQRYQVSGTGMGLAIAKAIIEAHGGFITVTSQLGSGSVFTLRVPRA